MDAAAVPPDAPTGLPSVGVLLDRIAAADYQQVPVVNSVVEPPPLIGPHPEGWGRRTARRRAAWAERRRRKHPEKYRVEFAAWAPIPWRDRPIEARLADYAQATAGAVTRCAAWRHPMLEGHRLLLDPAREGAEIALGAYRVYLARRELAEPLRPGPDAPAVAVDALDAAARAGYGASRAALEEAWRALLRRLAALDDYRRRLEAIGPELAAADAAESLTGTRLSDMVGRAVTAGVGDDLAAADTDRLAREAEALGEMLAQARRRQDAAGSGGAPSAE